jgi:hypothetical protein
VVIGSIYDELKEKFVLSAKNMKVGYGLDESSEMGPMTTKENKERVGSGRGNSSMSVMWEMWGSMRVYHSHMHSSPLDRKGNPFSEWQNRGSIR